MIERKESVVPDGISFYQDGNSALRVTSEQKREPLVKRVLVGSWDATKAFVKSQNPEAHGRRILNIIDEKIVPKLNNTQKQWVEDHADDIRDAAMLAGAGVTTGEIIAAVAAVHWGFRKLFPYREHTQGVLPHSIRSMVTEYMPEGSDRSILITALTGLVTGAVRPMDPTLPDLTHPLSANRRRKEIRQLKNRLRHEIRRRDIAVTTEGGRVSRSYAHEQFLNWMEILQASRTPGHERQALGDWVRGQRIATEKAWNHPSQPHRRVKAKTDASRLDASVRRQERKRASRYARHEKQRLGKQEKRYKQREQADAHAAAPDHHEIHHVPRARSSPDWAHKHETLPGLPGKSLESTEVFAQRLHTPDAWVQRDVQQAIDVFDRHPEFFPAHRKKLKEVFESMIVGFTMPKDIEAIKDLPLQQRRTRIDALRKSFLRAYSDAFYAYRWDTRSPEEARGLFAAWMRAVGADTSRPESHLVSKQQAPASPAAARRTWQRAYLDGVMQGTQGKFDPHHVGEQRRIIRTALSGLMNPEQPMDIPPAIASAFVMSVTQGDARTVQDAFRNLMLYAAHRQPWTIPDEIVVDAVNRYIGVGAPGMHRILQSFGIPLGEAKHILRRMRQQPLHQKFGDMVHWPEIQSRAHIVGVPDRRDTHVVDITPGKSAYVAAPQTLQEMAEFLEKFPIPPAPRISNAVNQRIRRIFADAKQQLKPPVPARSTRDYILGFPPEVVQANDQRLESERINQARQAERSRKRRAKWTPNHSKSLKEFRVEIPHKRTFESKKAYWERTRHRQKDLLDWLRLFAWEGQAGVSSAYHSQQREQERQEWLAREQALNEMSEDMLHRTAVPSRPKQTKDAGTSRRILTRKEKKQGRTLPPGVKRFNPHRAQPAAFAVRDHKGRPVMPGTAIKPKKVKTQPKKEMPVQSDTTVGQQDSKM